MQMECILTSAFCILHSMFILDSLFISGFRWVLNTIVSAADAEMNDDTALRDQLLAAEMRRETGDISDEEFRAIEADLLARIREIKSRREGGTGPIAFGIKPGLASTRFAVEASVAGEFHEPSSSHTDEPTSRRSDEPTKNRPQPRNRRTHDSARPSNRGTRSSRSSRKIRRS
jgi:hypothetical protein